MSVTETVKDIYELVKKGTNLELQEKVLKLREEVLSLQEENLTLRSKLAEYVEKLKVKESIEFDGSVYWLRKPNDSKDGPYCQRCYDDKGKLARLQDWGEEGWRCSVCRGIYDRQ